MEKENISKQSYPSLLLKPSTSKLKTPLQIPQDALKVQTNSKVRSKISSRPKNILGPLNNFYLFERPNVPDQHSNGEKSKF